MVYKIVIDTPDEEIDSAIFKVYLDIKKKKYIKKQPLPKDLTLLDCECQTKIKYSVNKWGN